MSSKSIIKIVIYKISDGTNTEGNIYLIFEFFMSRITTLNRLTSSMTLYRVFQRNM